MSMPEETIYKHHSNFLIISPLPLTARSGENNITAIIPAVEKRRKSGGR
jgi:hypothetical protein